MMQVNLVLEKKNRKPKRIELRRARTVVGRQEGCNVRIPSAEVSRRHCLFHLAKNKVLVEDLKSVNGTYVNEVAVIGKEELCPGDRVRIGPVTFVVEFSPVPESIRQAPVKPPKVEVVEEDIEILEDVDEIPEGEIILDDDEPLLLPEAGHLRGILTELTDSEHPTPRKET